VAAGAPGGCALAGLRLSINRACPSSACGASTRVRGDRTTVPCAREGITAPAHTVMLLHPSLQMQQYPGGELHSQAVRILEEIHRVRERAGNFTVTWGGHVSSLDVMPLVRGHLHILATLATQVDAPPEQHTLASAPTTTTSSSGRSAGQVAVTPIMTDSLEAVFAVLCPLMDDFRACAMEARPQECMRALVQLVATPDIVTALLHLTLSPAMLAAADDRSHALRQRASACIGGLQHMLRTFHVAA
jgi:hypothetical protein